MRTFGVAFLATRVHDKSKRPIKTLINVPTSAWTVESKLLFDEVRCNTVALSGVEFFYFTRKLILSVVGTICTYELVLQQVEVN